MTVNVDIRPPEPVRVQIRPPTAEISTGNPIARDYSEIDTYDGEYEVTPTQEEQVLHTENKRMVRDVVISAIPSNYGLISWNGLGIRVS